MSKKLLRTKSIYDACSLHIKESGASDTEIESYLTQHILVAMCADIQQEIYSILENRLSHTQDREVREFAFATGKKILRSIGKKEVSGFISNFGPRAKQVLDANLDDKEVTLYSNAVKNRHDIAHNNGSNITFKELGDIIDAAVNFITTIELSLAAPTSASTAVNLERNV